MITTQIGQKCMGNTINIKKLIYSVQLEPCSDY